MKEKYLHNLWQSKNLPLNNLYLADGRKLEIIHFGYYNHSAPGPDFALGIIEVEGETFSGPIEIHVRASEWYDHRHHLDRSYDIVVLHVVLENDMEVEQNGRMLPTLELKSIIHPFYLLENQLSKSFLNPFPCSDRKPRVVHYETMKEWAIQKRMQELRRFAMEVGCDAWTSLLARAFKRSNVAPEFLKEFFPAELELRVRNKRPGNAQETRKRQFEALRNLRPESLLDISLNELNSQLQRTETPKLGNDFWRSLRVNAVWPYAYHKGLLQTDQLFQRLKEVAPEQNNLVKLWKDAHFEVSNAFDSQGLLFLYRYKCSLKKCLTCAVGKEILKNDSKNCFLL